MAGAQPVLSASPALARIFETYKRAWETRDADLVLTIFTEDAVYHENPFDRPMTGHPAIRRYWKRATRNQRKIEFHWSPVCSAGDLHVVDWKASYVLADGSGPAELRGGMIVELRGERIARFREYWHRRVRTTRKRKSLRRKHG